MSSRPDCIFEIHQLWQSGFSGVYSNSCCSGSFEHEIIKIGQSSYKMYSNNIFNFQEFATILKAYTKNVWKVIAGTVYIYIYMVKIFFSHFESMENKLTRERDKTFFLMVF